MKIIIRNSAFVDVDRFRNNAIDRSYDVLRFHSRFCSKMSILIECMYTRISSAGHGQGSFCLKDLSKRLFHNLLDSESVFLYLPAMKRMTIITEAN